MSYYTPSSDSALCSTNTVTRLAAQLNDDRDLAQFDDLVFFLNKNSRQCITLPNGMIREKGAKGLVATRNDLPRSNLLITNNGFLSWSATESAVAFADLLKIDQSPDFDVSHLASLAALEEALFQEKLSPVFMQYLMQGLNQELLFSPSMYWAEYRVSLMNLYPQLGDEISREKCVYSRQLDVVSSTKANFYLHTFYQNNGDPKLLSTTKMQFEQDYTGAIHCRQVSSDFQTDSTLFSRSQAHVMAQYALVKKTGLAAELGLSNLVALIDSVLSHQQRYLQSATQSVNPVDSKKARALNEIAIHAIGFVVAKSHRAPPSVLRRKAQRIKSSLLRNRADLSVHKNLLWRLWNSVICLLRGVPFRRDSSVSLATGADTKMAFFRPADTASLSLARNCTVACR